MCPPLLEKSMSDLKNEVEIQFSTGEKFVVKRFKAGLHYKAQIIFADWVISLRNIFKGEQKEELLKDDGTPDIEKIKERAKDNEDLLILLKKVGEAAQFRVKLAALALGNTPEEALENYYPEDLDLIAEEVIKLNDFLFTLKKLSAPTHTGQGAIQ